MSLNTSFAGTLDELDPELSRLVELEDKRQLEKIILIPSESMASPPVRQLMSSNFGNIYAEGYPRESSRLQTEDELLDVDAELAHFRRYGDPRYYKGVEYADILEALTRRRAAELFAANGIQPDEMFVNVQPLSGSPANTAVYSALLQPGDKVMGLDLIHGGHLTHGSKVSRSGKLYQSVPYYIDLEDETLNYAAIERLALETQPNLIVAGFTAYPCIVDWKRFREIADKCGAYLMADIAHISGLVAAGLHPSPIGIADVITTTTHKSLCGPRGAMIMTHLPKISRRIDRAVFPGEQGGPHLNNIAALALALKLAKTEDFKELMGRVVSNASRLAEKLTEGGIRIVSGGTENHLLLLDTKGIQNNGLGLSGDMAARILDVAGIVTNRNTIPGDTSAFRATGVRLGTVWISQLGYSIEQIDLLAEAISTLLQGCKPFEYSALGNKKLNRSKVDPAALRRAREIVAELTQQERRSSESNIIEIRGDLVTNFLQYATTSDIQSLKVAENQPTRIIGPDFVADGRISKVANDRYYLQLDAQGHTTKKATEWLVDLSDGYVDFGDIYAKLPGPIVSKQVRRPTIDLGDGGQSEPVAIEKPFFIGHDRGARAKASFPEFTWEEPHDDSLKETKLHDTHIRLGGRMVPFGGWDMPVWYTSVGEEHASVRESAGLFDVSHMGVLEASGPYAATFLNSVSTNDIDALEIGRSFYTYLLFPDGSVVDDLLIYRRGHDKFMLVVNAANNDKDWAWLNAVNDGVVRIDEQRPWSRLTHPTVLRDLRDPQWGNDCLVDIALQGPSSVDILLKLCDDPALMERIKNLPWAGLTEGIVGGFPVVISRTGYTGERVAYELFLHPDQTPQLWQKLLDAGDEFGLRPCGLAARDSTRTEAGLPLYGHELAGLLNLNPAQAGFKNYLKLWKPFFVGRQPYINQLENLEKVIVRFRMDDKGVRRPELGDPIVDKRGKIVGTVTSCAIDTEGYLLGQAIVPLNYSEPGTSFSIYQLGGGTRSLRVPASLAPGAKLPIPDRATILTRFPARRK